MSCGCGGGAPPWHPSPSYGDQNRELEFAAHPLEVRGGRRGQGQPGRAPAPASSSETTPWHVWVILVITVLTFLKGRNG
jgi:hypothetical protein